MIFDLLVPPQGAGPNKCAVARPIYVSISHTKFGWISSNGLGGDSVTDGQTFWPFPWPQGAGPKYCDVVYSIYVSKSHTKFDWIS